MELTNAEWKLMKLLWEKPMSIAQLTKACKGYTDWGKNTIIVFLKRLMDKGAISFRQEERTKIFFPLVDKDIVSFDAAEELLGRSFSGKCSLLIDNLLTRNALSGDEIARIREMLNAYDKRKE